jgi:alternate signal-mediated exported protein
MKKTTKGVLAASAAGTLLLGGAGSFAFWQATSTVSGSQLQSGSISLSAPDCSTALGSHGWQLDNGDPYVAGTTKIVPGDTISKVCDMTLTLVGDHIGADLSIDATNITGDADLSSELTSSATFVVDGSPYAPITDPGTHTVRATLSVGFDGPGATNASQNGTVDFDAITVTADQTHTP